MQLKQFTEFIDLRTVRFWKRPQVDSALVVYAHPDPSSLTAALCERVVRGLETSGKEVTVIDLYDLYEEGFLAAMSPDERFAYEGPDPIRDVTIRRHAQLIRNVDAIVLVYPTWNLGLPAILKGWIERVLVPGVGFVLDEQTNKVKGGLGHIGYFVGVTTYPSSRISTALHFDGGKRMVSRTLRMMSPNLTTRTKWFGLFRVGLRSPKHVSCFLDEVERSMAQL